ncbi:MAG: amino acid adenylation domain-containing protein, partial [bacterium]|nr:amino acid adenylation domain-containing protein [bacterium]
FDASNMDIYGALLNGAAVYPFDIKQEGKLVHLIHWLREEKITIYHSVPTVYRYFTDTLADQSEANEKTKDQFPHLRLIIMGGEAVYKSDVEKFKSYFPDNGLFVNLFGSTESSIGLLYFINQTTEVTGEALPIGFPVGHTEVYLIKENKKEAPIYGTGEIVYTSDFLSPGYCNQVEKTAEIFVKNPLTGKDLVYRTLDMGRRLPDGSIEFVNRRDYQVKIRGYRVELGEIESLLDTAEGVEKSVVVIRQDPGDENYLAAFYVKEAEQEVDESNLTGLIKESLPEYMRPSVFMSLSRMPLTNTG